MPARINPETLAGSDLATRLVAILVPLQIRRTVLASTMKFTVDRLFQRIDAMPMRQREMRRR